MSQSITSTQADPTSNIVVSLVNNPSVNFTIEMNKPKEQSLTPLQVSLGSLAGCEVATMRYLAHQMKLNIGEVTHKRIEGWFDVRGFAKGEQGVPAHFQHVDIEIVVETDATEEQIAVLKERVEVQCPVHSMFRASGCQMNSKWTVKKM